MACYPSQHLTIREWGLLEVCLRLTSGGKNPLYFDGRKMASRFARVGKDAVYTVLDSLVEHGWLIEVARRQNAQTKRYEATIYNVLTHEQWTAKHGTRACQKTSEESSLEIQTGGASSSLENQTGASLEMATSQSGFSPSQSGKRREPVWKSRHSSVFSSVKPSDKPSDKSVPCGPGKAAGSSPGHKGGPGETRPLTALEKARERQRQANEREGELCDNKN